MFRILHRRCLEHPLVRLRRASIKIGISGCNNIGKSTLALAVERRVASKGLDVGVVTDRFDHVGAYVEPREVCFNYAVLLDQMVQEVLNERDVVIFDQTLVDHLCYFKLRAEERDSTFRTFAAHTATIAKGYDRNVFLRPTGLESLQDTTHLTASQRRQMDEMLQRFFTDFAVDVVEHQFGVDGFHTEIADCADRIAGDVVSIHTRRLSASQPAGER